MRYHANAIGNGEEPPDYFAEVRADPEVACPDFALRHARAMKSVLLAAKAWHREMLGASEMRLRAAEDRLSLAQERLAKIEKEVSRG